MESTIHPPSWYTHTLLCPQRSPPGGTLAPICEPIPTHRRHPKHTVHLTVQSRWCAFFACACSVAQTCPTLCDPVDCNLPNSTARGLFQARLLDWFCHFLLQGIYPNPGSNSHCLCPLCWQADSLPLGHLRCTMAWVWRAELSRCPKDPLCSTYSPLNHCCFTVSIVPPFPEWPIIAITQYGACAFSRSGMHLRLSTTW